MSSFLSRESVGGTHLADHLDVAELPRDEGLGEALQHGAEVRFVLYHLVVLFHPLRIFLMHPLLPGSARTGSSPWPLFHGNLQIITTVQS